MKIVFYLMNYKGYVVLEDFLEKYDSKSIEYVVVSKDKNVEKDFFNEISQLCKEENVTIYDRKDILPDFKGYKLAIGWRWLIRDNANLIVMHDSILPKYRGFSPLVNMLINGEEKIGVTALFATSGYDEGDIIMQKEINIEYPIKINEAIRNIAPLYSSITLSIFAQIEEKNKLVSIPQKSSEATYSLWRDELDYEIDWNKASFKIRREIDSLSFPYTGAKTYLNGERITILDAEEYEDVIIENRQVGKVIFISNGFPIIVCGSGLLKVTRAIDTENKSILPLQKFRSRFGGIKFS